jgi:hypothetical protein
MFAADVIARLTTGAPFPGETEDRRPMNVLVCVTEDSEGRVKSRLRTAEADLDRVYFVSGPDVSIGGLTMPSPMMLGDDAAGMLKAAKQTDASCLFLETIVEHFGDRQGKMKLNTGVEADVRRALAPVREICKQAKLFGFGALHPRKSQEGSLTDSIGGSVAFNNVGRGVLHILRDPSDESGEVRLLCSSKANYLRRLPDTLRFRIDSWDPLTNARCSCARDRLCPHEGRVVWDTTDLVDKRKAEDVWREVKEQSKQRRDTAVMEAEEFLTRFLAEGEAAPDVVYNEAKKEHISESALKTAKKNLGVISVMTKDFPAKVQGWQLPPKEAQRAGGM